MTWPLSAFADEAGDTTEQQIAALRRAGIKHIDIRSIDGFNCTVLPLDKARSIRRQLDAAGIRAAMFGSPIGKIDIADDFAIDTAKLAHLGQLKDILGCRAVRIFSYYNKGQQPRDQWQKESLSRLRQLRDQAAKLGLMLYHENEHAIFGEYLADVQTIAKELRDGKTLGLIFDFDNYNQAGEDVRQYWEQLRTTTDAIHLKDSDKNKQHVPVGQGNGRVREILADALARGWQGPLTLEPHLSYSKAVLATGPGGQINQELAGLTPAESFHVAAEAATKLLRELNAPVA
jgi:sugar phosphate isomerase/epimerase